MTGRAKGAHLEVLSGLFEVLHPWRDMSLVMDKGSGVVVLAASPSGKLAASVCCMLPTWGAYITTDDLLSAVRMPCKQVQDKALKAFLSKLILGLQGP